MRRLFSFRLIPAIVAIAVLSACGGQSEAEEPTTPQPDVASNAPLDGDDAPTSGDLKHGELPGDMALGNADAPVTLIEYASSTCPACAYFHETMFERIKSDYIETGKVRFIFREFPTPPAQLAYITFAVARCHAEGKGAENYFTMLDGFYRNQDTWLRGNNPLQEIVSLSAQAGFDEESVKACVARQDVIDAINANIKTGAEQYDITGTPSFVLNGERMERYNSEDEFFEMLDAAIAEAS